jgi:hypothetical protein
VVDDYIDEFSELVEEAGYVDDLSIVMKFQHQEIGGVITQPYTARLGFPQRLISLFWPYQPLTRVKRLCQTLAAFLMREAWIGIFRIG